MNKQYPKYLGTLGIQG